MRIQVRGQVTADRIQYFVQDQGPGIPAQYHDKIFGLFQRLDSRQEGTGVGLAIVSKIMKVNGGQVSVKSEPGAGSTFILTFPRSLLPH